MFVFINHVVSSFNIAYALSIVGIEPLMVQGIVHSSKPYTAICCHESKTNQNFTLFSFQSAIKT